MSVQVPVRQTKMSALPSFSYNDNREDFVKNIRDESFIVPVPVIYTNKTIDNKKGVVYVGDTTRAPDSILCLYPVFILTDEFLKNYEYDNSSVPFQNASASERLNKINLFQWHKHTYPVQIYHGRKKIEGLGFPAKWYSENPESWYKDETLPIEQRIIRKMNEPIELVDPDAIKVHELDKKSKTAYLLSLAGFCYRPPQLIKVESPTEKDVQRLKKHLYPNIEVDSSIRFEKKDFDVFPLYLSNQYLVLYSTQKIAPGDELLGCYGSAYLEVDPNFRESEECETPGIYKKMEINFDLNQDPNYYKEAQPMEIVEHDKDAEDALDIYSKNECYDAVKENNVLLLQHKLSELPSTVDVKKLCSDLLLVAVEQNRFDIVQFLLHSNQADPLDATGRIILAAITQAYEKKNMDVLKLFLNDRRVNLEAIVSAYDVKYREMINTM